MIFALHQAVNAFLAKEKEAHNQHILPKLHELAPKRVHSLPPFVNNNLHSLPIQKSPHIQRNMRAQLYLLSFKVVLGCCLQLSP